MKVFSTVLILIFNFNIVAKTIVIDPGHGGDDHGAKRFLKLCKKKVLIAEKNLALDLAKKIKKRLEPTHKVYLTRTVDREVSLMDRASIAEKLQADLFISVHINASSKKKPRGFETYYLDNHKDSAVKKVEELENNTGTFEGEELIIRQILTELLISKTVDTSKALARSIHGQVHKQVGRPYKMINRGVKPGLFFVLALAKRPAVLLEVGFLSNSKELKRMLSSEFQDRYAQAVADGINQYLKTKK
jgi:N-acetylmuramoyl-L-alanine amidase